jgi:hypothetical protein
VLAVTRLGYPVQVGQLRARSNDVVGGVRYRRLLPARLAPTLDARLQLGRVGRERVLQTRTWTSNARLYSDAYRNSRRPS